MDLMGHKNGGGTGKDGTQSPFCQLRICVKAYQFYVNFTPSIRERMKIKKKQGILRNKTELQNNNLVFNADPDPDPDPASQPNADLGLTLKSQKLNFYMKKIPRVTKSMK